MSSDCEGFALYEVVLGLVLLVAGGYAIGRGMVAVTRAVAEGRRWSDAAFLGGSVMGELEAAYRGTAPQCVAPLGGTVAGRGVRATWWVFDSGGSASVGVEIRAGVRVGSLDTLPGLLRCR